MQLNFEFTPKIDKEFLLSKYSEETYMEYYLNIPVKKGLVRNPLRNDNNPTASFYRNSVGELIFNDFGSNFHGNFINVVMTKYDCSYHKACEIIAKDFNLTNKDTPVYKESIINVPKFQYKGTSKIEIQSKDFSKEDLDWWKQYNISIEILHKFNVYSCKSIFLNDALFAQSTIKCPIYGYYMGTKNNKELWRIYFPARTSYRFISNTNSELIQGIDQLPKKGSVLVITKSMKDVMCLCSFGIPAIAPNSEKLFIKDTILKDLQTRFKYIIVFYDNDIPGLEGMKRIKKNYPELIYTWLPHNYAKDISDFYKNFGKEKTLTILKQFIKWLKNRQS